MPLFAKNAVHFGFFANEMECERGKQDFINKAIVLNGTTVLLIFEYTNSRKTSFKKYYTIGQFQLLQRQIYNLGLRVFPLLVDLKNYRTLQETQ